MIKRYITLCAIFMAHMSFAALHNFHETRELDPRDQKKLFNQLQQIPHHNIVAAVLCYGAEHKNDQAQLAVHALINPFNWPNAKFMSAPLLALFGGAMAYATRKSPPLRLLSAACGLVGLYKAWQNRHEIYDLARVCKNSKPLIYNHLSKEDQACVRHLFPRSRKLLRISHVSIKASALTHTPTHDIPFSSAKDYTLLYFSKDYLKAYQHALDIRKKRGNLFTTYSLQIEYNNTPLTIVVPVSNGKSLESLQPRYDAEIHAQITYFEATIRLGKGNIMNKHILTSLRCQNEDINSAYNNNKKIQLMVEKNNQSPELLLSSHDLQAITKFSRHDFSRKSPRPGDPLKGVTQFEKLLNLCNGRQHTIIVSIE